MQVASGVSAMAAGYNHSFYLKTDGTLWAMGRNTNGQLGDGTTTSRNTPVQVASGVSAVSAGDAAKAGTLFQSGQSVIDSIADKGLFHKNKAARHKSRLAGKIKALATAAA